MTRRYWGRLPWQWERTSRTQVIVASCAFWQNRLKPARSEEEGKVFGASGTLLGIASLVFGIIVMIFPKILNYLVGIYLIIFGLILLIF